MSSPITVPAPAKLNLFLHITGRRDDGYHELQTLFQFIEECDYLTFQVRSDNLITLTPEIPGVPLESNLIYRAAVALQNHANIQKGADIQLDKRLPMGGGIGGGSSDAATTLLALNKLWEANLSLETLAEIGIKLGADVPVFVLGHAAWAEGVGEKLTAVNPPEKWFVVLKPNDHIDTAKIFQHKELTRNSSPIKLRASSAGDTRNDCESVVRKLSPAVDEALSWLSNFGPARLTGTGACIFLSCDSEQEAKAILNKSSTSGFVTKGCNISPAHRTLQLA